MADHDVKNVAVDDQIFLAVRRFVNCRLTDLDAAEMGAIEVAQEFVVVPGNIDYSRALAPLAQQFLDDVIVALRPVPALSQTPAVNDVTNKIDDLGIVKAQKLYQ